MRSPRGDLPTPTGGPQGFIGTFPPALRLRPIGDHKGDLRVRPRDGPEVVAFHAEQIERTSSRLAHHGENGMSMSVFKRVEVPFAGNQQTTRASRFQAADSPTGHFADADGGDISV